jgi:hypothetical protein
MNVTEYRRAIENGQSRETGNIGYARRRKTKQRHNTICIGHHYTQTNRKNVNKICVLLQLEVNSSAMLFVVQCGVIRGPTAVLWIVQ